MEELTHKFIVLFDFWIYINYWIEKYQLREGWTIMFLEEASNPKCPALSLNESKDTNSFYDILSIILKNSTQL